MDIVDKVGIYVVYTQYLKKIERWFVFLLSISVYEFEENIKIFMRIC
jgi:hypothetical protein